VRDIVATPTARIAESLRRTDGQTLAEYALILALIAILAVLALLFLGGAISAQLSDVARQI
jgi:Flp pilus assembly pilin Flp